MGSVLDEAAEVRLAATIIEIARDLRRSVPPPRGAPYFCLDSAVPYDLSVLDRFCSRGIFRKYEFALDVGSGLGGRARWLAARSGCRVVGVDPSLAVVVAAHLLNRYAHMDGQVSFQVGGVERLPFRERVFTHVWVVDPVVDAGFAAVLAEAFRVLRPGGHCALQVRRSPPTEPDDLIEALRGVGFVDCDVRQAIFTEGTQACAMARDQLRAALRKWCDATAGERFAAGLHAAAGVQIFARRSA
jgi:SAM-dependent methyltransferase